MPHVILLAAVLLICAETTMRGDCTPARFTAMSEAVLAHPDEPNYIDLNTFRADDEPHWPSAAFKVDVAVSLPNVPGVTGVAVACTGGFSASLDSDDAVYWLGNNGYTDLASMKDAIDGDWTVTIDGPSPSVSTFSVDAGVLSDGDYFATPTSVFPPHGADDVPADVVFTWNDPTGPQTPYALAVLVQDEDGAQADDSLFGSMDITDTSWDPPMDLNPGSNEFEVLYANVDVLGLVGALSVVSGSIEWGESPAAPVDYPLKTPLLIIGSQTWVAFDVAPPSPADVNGDGTVDVLDLLEVLAAWGPCP